MPDTEYRFFRERAAKSLAALDEHRDRSHANIRLPGVASRNGRRFDSMEGFSRSLLLLSFLREDRSSTVSTQFEKYRRGIVAGSGLGSGSWPRPKDFGQAIVESASIALALAIAPARLWSPLSADEKMQVASYLTSAARCAVYPNNWVMFPAVVARSLASLGLPMSDERVYISRARVRLEQLYESDGWYSDGGKDRFDYYNNFAFHFYPPLLSLLELDLVDRDVTASRLRDFTRTAYGYFSADGRMVYKGRSLVYRFGTTAPFWLAEMLGCSDLPSGSARILGERVFQRLQSDGGWESGLFTYSWAAGGHVDRQPYSGPSSPLWNAKGFVGLLAPANSPVWTSRYSPTTKPILVGQQLQMSTVDVPAVSVVMAPHATPDRRLVRDFLYDADLYSTHASAAQSNQLRGGTRFNLRAKEIHRRKAETVDELTQSEVVLGWERKLPRPLAYRIRPPRVTVKSLKVYRTFVRLDSSVLVILAVRALRSATLEIDGWAIGNGTVAEDGHNSRVVDSVEGIESSLIPVAGLDSSVFGSRRIASPFGATSRQPTISTRLQRGLHVLAYQTMIAPIDTAPGHCNARQISADEIVVETSSSTFTATATVSGLRVRSSCGAPCQSDRQ
ncbi:DUF2264 domain-containing protein [Microbacterium marmarense]|uniref:DUF2264 domain-containing protein n=1 Tax=Microbacterium marmarense TaxID=3122051 RepID=A0ABU8LUR7_9MICO